MPKRIAESTRCTALRDGGSFCDRESLPDAPFPICLNHASKLLRYLNSVMPADPVAAVEAVRKVEAIPRPVRAVELDVPGDGVPVVYYMRIGALVKIGYSINLHQRIRHYPPDAELLAYEPGSPTLERKLLKQFRHDLRGRMEWFRPSPALLEHIERVAAAQQAAA